MMFIATLPRSGFIVPTTCLTNHVADGMAAHAIANAAERQSAR